MDQLLVVAGRGEAGHAIQDEVDLGDDARGPVVRGPPAHRRPERHWIDELDERPLRIEPGDDRRRGDLLTRRQHDAGDRALAGGDRRYPRAAANLGTGRPGSRSQRFGQRAGSADGVDRLPGGTAVVPGTVAEEDGRRPGRPRPEE